MRILEVISSLGPTGGAETFAVHFSRSINQKEQLTVVILYSDNKQHFINLLKEKNIEPIVLNKNKHFDFKIIRQLRKIIREKKIEIIHTENNALISSFFAILPLKNKPHIFHTVHNPAPIEAGGKISKLLYKRFMKTKFVTPVAISKEMALSCEVFYKLKNVDFIPNGIDLEKFDSSKKLEDRKYDVSIIARFENQKNHYFLLEVFNKVHQKYNGLNVIMAGSGSLENSIKEKIKQIGAEKYILMPGLVNDSSEILNDSKIIALGSNYEGNPLCLLEGMAAGNVVISTAVGGIPDVVINNVNGFLFKVGDVDGFSDKIYDVLTNIGEYNKMREINSEKSKDFSMNFCVEQYISLFRKII